MPGNFMPILGILGSALFSFALAPKPPSPPEPAPAPPAPKPAPLPKAPPPPKKEATVSPEDAKENARQARIRRQRASTSALAQPLSEDDPSSYGRKTLLGD